MKSELIDRLEDVRTTRRGWRARCPAHPDRRPSLDLAEGADGRLLVQCRAGCRTADVLQALGARWGDLFRDEPPRQHEPRRRGSLLDQARERVLAEARRQKWARPGILEAYHRAALLRCLDRTVALARRVATTLGPTADVWTLLDAAGGLERVLLLEDGELVA